MSHAHDLAARGSLQEEAVDFEAFCALVRVLKRRQVEDELRASVGKVTPNRLRNRLSVDGFGSKVTLERERRLSLKLLLQPCSPEPTIPTHRSPQSCLPQPGSPSRRRAASRDIPWDSISELGAGEGDATPCALSKGASSSGRARRRAAKEEVAAAETAAEQAEAAARAVAIGEDVLPVASTPDALRFASAAAVPNIVC